MNVYINDYQTFTTIHHFKYAIKRLKNCLDLKILKQLSVVIFVHWSNILCLYQQIEIYKPPFYVLNTSAFCILDKNMKWHYRTGTFKKDYFLKNSITALFLRVHDCSFYRFLMPNLVNFSKYKSFKCLNAFNINIFRRPFKVLKEAIS